MIKLEREIKYRISQLIEEGRSEFIIYPFGEFGEMTKDILNRLFGIQELCVLDNFKTGGGGSNVHPVTYLKSCKINKDVRILMTVKDFRLREELKRKISPYISREQLVEIWTIEDRVEQQIEFQIRYCVFTGKRKFFIYPHDEGGIFAKSILNHVYGITELGFIDDESADEGVYPLTYLKQYREDKDVCVLLLTEHYSIKEEQKNRLRQYIQDDRIFEIWQEYVPYEQDYLHDKAAAAGMDDRERILHMKSHTVNIWLPFYDIDILQKSILLSDAYHEESLLYYVSNSFRKGAVKQKMQQGTVLDIGANIGNHTLYYALECKANHIYAFEPIAETYQILCKNICLNQLENKVSTLNAAVGEKHARGEIGDVLSRINSGGCGIREAEKGTFDIVSIDELNLGNVVFMKIDVEGFECNVIKGALDTIKRYQPFIVLEAFDCTGHIFGIIDMLAPLGYHWEKISPADYFFYPEDC